MQLFYSIFKTLVGKEITVELKNDLEIQGTLHSVDQYLNFRLNNVHVVNEERFPHMVRRHRAIQDNTILDPNTRAMFAALGEELFHPRLCRAVCPHSVEGGRRGAAPGRDTTRGHARQITPCIRP